MNIVESIKSLFTEQNSDLKGSLASKEDILEANKEIKADLESLKSTASDQSSEIEALNSQITDLKAKNESLTEKLEASEAKVKELQSTIDDPKGEIEKKANAKATAIIANSGVDADKLPADKENNTGQGKKKDYSELKGRDRLVASIRDEIGALNN